jgi:hypothetical protein
MISPNKPTIIPINNKYTNNEYTNDEHTNKHTNNYNYIQDTIDPLQQSPPNEFMKALLIRMNRYNINNKK